jgi:hypothetical protein
MFSIYKRFKATNLCLEAKCVSKLDKMLTGGVNDDYLDFSLWQNQNVM